MEKGHISVMISLEDLREVVAILKENVKERSCMDAAYRDYVEARELLILAEFIAIQKSRRAHE